MRSFSEIEVTTKKASKAIGFSWGISEEIGKNIRLLEMFGLSGLKNLNSYFKIYNQKQFQKISLISKINTSPPSAYSPACITRLEASDIVIKNLVTSL